MLDDIPKFLLVNWTVLALLILATWTLWREYMLSATRDALAKQRREFQKLNDSYRESMKEVHFLRGEVTAGRALLQRYKDAREQLEKETGAGNEELHKWAELYADLEKRYETIVKDLYENSADLSKRVNEVSRERDRRVRELEQKAKDAAEEARNVLSRLRELEPRHGQIFISYRRTDDKDFTERIYDQLLLHFGDDVVIDLRAVKAGVVWRDWLVSAVTNCRVLLAIVGEQWLTLANPDGSRKIEDPDDAVRLEIELAIRNEIPIIPVLLKAAPVPPPRELPSILVPLTNFQAARIRPNPDFYADIEGLVARLKMYVKTSNA